MSTITVDNFKGTAEASGRSVSGIAAVWASYDQTVPQVDGSEGLSSVTDNATGEFTLTFSASFADAHYTRIGCAESGGNFVLLFEDTATAATTSAVRLHTQNSAATSVDRENVSALINGGLA